MLCNFLSDKSYNFLSLFLRYFRARRCHAPHRVSNDAARQRLRVASIADLIAIRRCLLRQPAAKRCRRCQLIYHNILHPNRTAISDIPPTSRSLPTNLPQHHPCPKIAVLPRTPTTSSTQTEPQMTSSTSFGLLRQITAVLT